MIDPTTAPRSESDTSERADDDAAPSGADEAPASSAWGTGRTHPTVISGRVSHAVKDRAKAAAEERGQSMCEFVRKAIHSALRDHADEA